MNIPAEQVFKMDDFGDVARLIVFILIVFGTVFVNWIKKVNKKIQDSMEQKKRQATNRNMQQDDFRNPAVENENLQEATPSEKPQRSNLMKELERALRGMEQSIQQQIEPEPVKPATPPPLPQEPLPASYGSDARGNQIVSAHAKHSTRIAHQDTDGRRYTATGIVIEEAASVKKLKYRVPSLKSPGAIRNAFILHEILGPPISLKNKPNNPAFRKA